MALFLFDTEIVLAGETTPDNRELALALGSKTIVHWTSTQSLTYIGLSNLGGLPTDKMVVCFANANNNSFIQNFAHESGATSNAAFRFRNRGLTTVNGSSSGGGAVTFAYYGTLQRWLQIGGTG